MWGWPRVLEGAAVGYGDGPADIWKFLESCLVNGLEFCSFISTRLLSDIHYLNPELASFASVLSNDSQMDWTSERLLCKHPTVKTEIARFLGISPDFSRICVKARQEKEAQQGRGEREEYLRYGAPDYPL